MLCNAYGHIGQVVIVRVYRVQTEKKDLVFIRVEWVGRRGKLLWHEFYFVGFSGRFNIGWNELAEKGFMQ